MRRSEGTRKAIAAGDWENALTRVTLRKEDMNKLVMDFLLTEGYHEAAKTFQQESGTAPKFDVDSIGSRAEIRNDIQHGDVETAITKVNRYLPELLDSENKLSFYLRQQQVLELIAQDRTEEALDVAETFMAPLGEENPDLLSELENTMSLLAFKDLDDSPAHHLLSSNQRYKTACRLNTAILDFQNQAGESKLPKLLKLVLWEQKQLEPKVDFPNLEQLIECQH